jgi:methionyl-tRNA formyltransferase
LIIEELRYAYFGTGAFAARCLELLSEWRMPSWVVTPPFGASRGRNAKVRSPVGELVSGGKGAWRGVPLVESANASSDGAVLELKKNVRVDFTFVVDFGQFIREPLLDESGRIGCLNIHPSGLPCYRGAAPIRRALMDGVSEVGVSIFRLGRGMDSGPVLIQDKLEVGPYEDFGSVSERAAVLGAEAFIGLVSKTPVREWSFLPQDEALATYAPKISPGEERIDWGMTARAISNRVRAFSPRPGAWTTLRGKRLLILSARPIEVKPENGASPGELCLGGGNPLVASYDGLVELITVQPDGKKPLPASAWKNGLRLCSKECLK